MCCLLERSLRRRGPAVAAMSLVTGARGAWLVSSAMAISIFVTLNGSIMSGARVPYAAARDGLFFKRMADVSPRFESPSTSLVVQGVLATGLLLAVGRFQQLFELAIFAGVVVLHDYGYLRCLCIGGRGRIW